MIFETNKNKRWKTTIAIFITICAAALVLIVLTTYSIYTNCSLPGKGELNINKGSYISSNLIKLQSLKNYNRKTDGESNPPKGSRHHYNAGFHYLHPSVSFNAYNKNRFITSAFVSTKEDDSINDLRKHIGSLNLVLPDYFQLVPGQIQISEFVREDVQKLLSDKHIMVAPRLANDDDNGNWYGKQFIDLISDKTKRTALENLILATLQKYDLHAINMDIEDISSYDVSKYPVFLNELSNLLHENNMYLTVDVPVNDSSFDYAQIGKASDLVFVMDYDEHDEGGLAGPIAGRGWFNGAIDNIVNSIPKNKIIGIVSQYAYDWNIDKGGSAQSLGFDDAVMLAADTGADIQTDKDSVNSMFCYVDGNKNRHEVWLTDGISMWNQMLKLNSLGIKGGGIWRLGTEDPTIWDFYGKNMSSLSPQIMQNCTLLNPIYFDGEGEIVKISTEPQSGERTINVDDNKQIDYADYKVLPTGYTVQKYGKVDPKEIVLTFDDGPSQQYTPQVINVLEKYNVPATFFVVGEQAMHYPDIVRKEAKEGFLVGNHTYYHPQSSDVSPKRMELELNTTQRLIEALTGKKTILFRSPYNTDTDPTDIDQLFSVLSTSSKLGYIMVGADIDSDDYEKPGVDKIVANVEDGLQQTGSNIIVMHDAGGDRSQTVAALEKLIPDLRSKGYKFVNLDTLTNLSKSELMPTVDLPESFLVFSDKAITWLSIYGWDFIQILFYITTFISMFRIIFLGSFVIRSKKMEQRYDNKEDFEPFVTVLIPAYNEETVIAKTIKGVLESKYDNYEIIVINDGSTDSTADEVLRITKENAKVRLITKENGGKFSALNAGFQNAKSDYVITIDADTIILPDTLKNLILPFSDPGVDAVCGNVQVGNVKNIITGFQTVEYITTQNYDRRAFDSLNCIGVVPGATGAWRKSKVLEVGGYSNETLTEDADLTLTMLEHGARIVYMPSARSVTEAPQTVKTLFKQRFRWSFGTMQTMWKHRKSFFRGSLGKVALPNIFLFQVLFPILSPIGDLVFIISIFRGDMMAVLSGYILFLLMDLAGSLIAFSLEKSRKRFLFYVFIQRFFYRQFMYVITYKSIIAAIKGRKHGWNKLKRTNSVKVPEAIKET